MSDSEKLIALLKSNQNILRNAGISATGTLRLVDCLVSSDVVRVVRCRDCKHMEITPYGRWCNAWFGINGMGDEGFCNYGERKEGE